MKYDLKSFAKRLSEIIDARYFQRAQLAQYCGVHRSQITLYCNGQRRPTPQHLLTICMALDCSPEWLKNGKGSIKDKFDYNTSTSLKVPQKFNFEKHGRSTIFSFILSSNEFKQLLTAATDYNTA